MEPSLIEGGFENSEVTSVADSVKSIANLVIVDFPSKDVLAPRSKGIPPLKDALINEPEDHLKAALGHEGLGPCALLWVRKRPFA